jgi:hypothetical protein
VPTGASPDLHSELALSHEDRARTLRFGGGREGA